MNLNKDFCKSITDLLDIFEENVSDSDILASKLKAQISTALIRERLKLRMNQKDFAHHIGVSQTEVSRWESGENNFTLKKIAEIACKLNMDVNFSMTNISISKQTLFPQNKIIRYSPEQHFQSKSFLTKEDKLYATIR